MGSGGAGTAPPPPGSCGPGVRAAAAAGRGLGRSLGRSRGETGARDGRARSALRVSPDGLGREPGCADARPELARRAPESRLATWSPGAGSLELPLADFPRPLHLPQLRQRHLAARPALRTSGRTQKASCLCQECTGVSEPHNHLGGNLHSPPPTVILETCFRRVLGVTEDEGKVTVSEKAIGRRRRPGGARQL